MSSRDKSTPHVVEISAETTFETFDSLLVVDTGSDGFNIKDVDDSESFWPSGIPFSIGKQEGKAAGPITIKAPDTGTLAATAVYYK